MFFLFEPDIVEWNGKLLQAEVSRYSKAHYKFQEKWWFGEKLPEPIPQFQFKIDENAPFLDNYWTAAIFDLYSEKLISILSERGIQNEAFPVKIKSLQTGKTILAPYKLFRLLEVEDVADEEKSIYKTLGSENFSTKLLKTIVFRDELLQTKKQIFRITNHENIVVINEDLKEVLAKNDISGCRYSPIEHMSIDFDL